MISSSIKATTTKIVIISVKILPPSFVLNALCYLPCSIGNIISQGEENEYRKIIVFDISNVVCMCV